MIKYTPDNAFSVTQLDSITHLFATFEHITLQKNLVELNAVKQISFDSDELEITLMLSFAWKQGFQSLKEELDTPLKEIMAALSVTWKITYQVATLARANDLPAIKGIKNIIAVSSGKGGVGKSSIAVNLALALKNQGARVGILDADIYGPSVPHMLGAQDKSLHTPDNKHMIPIEAHGIYTNSIGYLMKADTATIWRGPVASTALTQLLQETLWPELDYLIIDMPPGTGDIQLTLSQKFPVTGAIVVTTPQNIALLDAEKGIAMFNKVDIPIIGIVENMSEYICSNCGYHETIFGEGGAEKTADKHLVHCLGHIPLHICIRKDLDKGVPTVIASPHAEISEGFNDLACLLASELYWQCKTIPGEIMFTEIQ